MIKIIKQKKYFLMLLLAFVFSGSFFFSTQENIKFSDSKEAVEYDGCTSVLVGRLASTDGSTITSHSCDSGSDRTWMEIVPNKKHKSGSLTKIKANTKETKGPKDDDAPLTGEIPQVPETYSYINSAYPCINEFQLAIGETTIGQRKELNTTEGIIDCPELYRLSLERAKTARDAIKVIDELTKIYGYNDTGECFTFADTKETWHFEIYGPGKGKMGAVWAAVRIPDDHVGVSANSPRIQEINLKDPDNYMASENIYSRAEELGLWKKDSGETFKVCYVYGGRGKNGNKREWRVLSKVAPSLNLDPIAQDYPISVKAERKFSAQDVINNFFRDYYQGTPFDFTDKLVAKNREGKEVLSPSACPFFNTDFKTLMNVKSERQIACVRATYVTVTQSRSWLPNAIGGVVWLAYDNPVTSVFVPFYSGITNMPKSYMVDGRRKYNSESGWWAFRKVSQFAKQRWQPMVADIIKISEEIETKAFKNQNDFEKKVSDIYKTNPKKAKQMLTKYSNDLANGSVDKYKILYDELWGKYTNSL